MQFYFLQLVKPLNFLKIDFVHHIQDIHLRQRGIHFALPLIGHQKDSVQHYLLCTIPYLRRDLLQKGCPDQYILDGVVIGELLTILQQRKRRQLIFHPWKSISHPITTCHQLKDRSQPIFLLREPTYHRYLRQLLRPH